MENDLISRSNLIMMFCECPDYSASMFKKIRQRIQAAPTIKQPTWISVKDGLPENDYKKHWRERRQFLVCLDNGQMRVAKFGYKEYDWWIDSHDCVLKIAKVVFWLPLSALPQPPRGVE